MRRAKHNINMLKYNIISITVLGLHGGQKYDCRLWDFRHTNIIKYTNISSTKTTWWWFYYKPKCVPIWWNKQFVVLMKGTILILSLTLHVNKMGRFILKAISVHLTYQIRKIQTVLNEYVEISEQIPLFSKCTLTSSVILLITVSTGTEILPTMPFSCVSALPSG